jgi:hypothetical protein
MHIPKAISNLFGFGKKDDNTAVYDKVVAQEVKTVEKHLERITFKPSCLDFGWGWKVEPVFGEEGVLFGFLVYSGFERPDTHTGEMGRGWGRGWFVQKDYTEKGLLMTAWLAIRQIVEHELLEAFSIDGARMFDPHKPLDTLAYPESMKRPDWLAEYKPANIIQIVEEEEEHDLY